MNNQPQELPEQLLERYFGYEHFRPLQKEIISCVLKKQDTLAVMPTGGGKSLCCQIPALIFPGLTLVISPLIALMQDQVAFLHRLGIPAAFLSSSLDRQSYFDSLAAVKRREIKLLYLSPEALSTERMRLLLASLPVDCIAVDEAHCISEWGQDFRPDYRLIARVRSMLPGAVCLALTATATESVRRDIMHSLSFREPAVFVADFNRRNIFLEVQEKKRPLIQLLHFLSARKGQCGIVYCLSRRQVDELAEDLLDAGFSVLPYHAGLDDDTRAAHLEAFLHGNVSIMAATVAFGMGIHKEDVRFVVHYDLPKSLEQYYQEIGRAGRDGKPACALLLYSAADAKKNPLFAARRGQGGAP